MLPPCCEVPPVISGALPVSLLVVAVAASGHCVGMCGGIVAAVTRNWGDVIRYHSGRLLGYLLLGSMAGYFGESLVRQTRHFFPNQLVLLAGAMMIGLGIGSALWPLIHAPHLPGFRFFQKGFNWISKLPSGLASFASGGFSIFLPCGLLWMAVLAAAGTASWIWGIAVMALFWLGTLPAMTLFSAILVPIKQRLQRTFPVVLGIFWVSIGVVTILWRLGIVRR